jgi:dipeptidyl aminopeptidase/acylaminoacyl peptidase
MRRAGVVIGVFAAVAGTLALALPASAGTFGGRNGRLAYVSNGQVFTMAAGGGGIRQLTNDPAGAAHPDWSPDGRTLAYDSGGRNITVVGADGSGTHTVTTDISGIDPTWSPDAKALAFTGVEYGDSGQIETTSLYVVAADGSIDHRIGPGSEPDWAAHGDWIVYVSNPARSGGCAGIWRMHPDGTGNSSVVPGSLDGGSCTGGGDQPSVSPDGKRVAYVSTDRKSVYTIGIGGHRRRLVARDGRAKSSPVFSPDGKRVAYSSAGAGMATAAASKSGGRTHRTPGAYDQLSWQSLPR